MLEHVLSEELEALIAAKLGNPTHDPHGDPIPSADLVIAEERHECLSALEPGAEADVVRISDAEPEMLRYLAEREIVPGTRLRVVDKQPFGGPLFVEVAGETHALGGQLADLDAGARCEPADADRGRRAPRDGAPPPEPRARRCSTMRARGKVRGVVGLLGPAFVAAVAYIDPGNFATNIAGGAKYGYMLLWVIVAANLMAMLVQYLSAKTGIATGKNLPELCREHFKRPVTLGPLGAGRGDRDRDRPRGVRRRRDRAQPALRRPAVRRRPDDRGRRLRDPRAADARAPQVRAGDHRLPRRSSSSASCTTCCRSASTRARSPRGLIPHFDGTDSVLLAVGILGATVMPHVVYLHSALTSTRIKPREHRRAAASCCASSASTSRSRWASPGFINITMLVVAAQLFHDSGRTDVDSIEGAHAGFSALLGGGAALAFAVALLASGLSSSSVGTFAGQVVMQGFINRRIPLFAAPRDHDGAVAGRAGDRRRPVDHARHLAGRALASASRSRSCRWCC